MMRTLLPLLLIGVMANATVCADERQTEQYRLKNGSMVFVRADGTMTMHDKNGSPMKMEDGVEMELEDGSILMMKNRHLWKQIGPAGKGRRIHVIGE